MSSHGEKRARRTAASAARDAISTAARLQSAALLHDQHDSDDNATPGRRRGLSKKVSYAEIPIGVDDVEEDEEPRSGGLGRSSGAEDEVGEGDEDVVMDGEEQAEDVGDAVEVGSSHSLPASISIVIDILFQQASHQKKQSTSPVVASSATAPKPVASLEPVPEQAKAARPRTLCNARSPTTSGNPGEPERLMSRMKRMMKRRRGRRGRRLLMLVVLRVSTVVVSVIGG
jgi:hypothetical protein